MTGLRQRKPRPVHQPLNEPNALSFAHGLNFYKLFWVFFIGSFLGVVVETLWLVVRMHVLESRVGLVIGPFNLVYGFGAVLITLALWPIRKKRDSVLFLGGMLVGSIYEYFCSWLQETLFGTVSWEYSDLPYNLHGRINLQYAMFWGILSVVWMKSIYPAMSRWIEEHIPNSIGKMLTMALVLFMVFDIFLSACAVGRMVVRRAGGEAGSRFEEVLDDRYPDERLKKIFPSMEFVE